MTKQNNQKTTVYDIILREDPTELRALFEFELAIDSDSDIIARFRIWGRYCFPKIFKQNDSRFHDQIDRYNMEVYRGTIKSFTDIVFRGGAKSTRTKLFVAFCIANDRNSYRRYYKWLSKDPINSKQAVTDIYNFFISPRVRRIYPAIFEKTDEKREETMHSFTTSNGIKMLSGTIGVEQRGHVQGDEASRPDFIVFDDFETRVSLRSAIETQKIWENMDEARTGLAVAPNEGGCLYLCNYLSERGNVHRLVLKENEKNVVLIVPIIKDGKPTWYHTLDEIKQIEQDAEDYAGDYLCKPSAGGDVMFDRDTLDAMEIYQPVRIIGENYKIYKTYNSSHRYAMGVDIAGGVGLDSSTSVTIDFDTLPARVVATYKDNKIKPDVLGYELAQQGNKYGACLIAPEKNNHGHATIAILKQNYDNIFYTQEKDTKLGAKYIPPKEYGWHTNPSSKPKMIFALKKAVEDGLLELTDESLIQECKSYSRDDLMDKEDDVRLTTRHFDLLIACAIAWQMKDFVSYEKIQTEEELEHLTSLDQVYDRFGIV